MDYHSFAGHCVQLLNEPVPADRKKRQEMLAEVRKCLTSCHALNGEKGTFVAYQRAVLLHIEEKLLEKEAYLVAVLAEEE